MTNVPLVQISMHSIDKKENSGMETGEIQPLLQSLWSLFSLCITPLLQFPTWPQYRSKFTKDELKARSVCFH